PRRATGVAGARDAWPARYWRGTWGGLELTSMATIPTTDGARQPARGSRRGAQNPGGERATPATLATLPLLGSRGSDSSKTPVAIMPVSPPPTRTTLHPCFRRAVSRERRDPRATRATLATLFLWSSRSSGSSTAPIAIMQVSPLPISTPLYAFFRRAG